MPQEKSLEYLYRRLRRIHGEFKIKKENRTYKKVGKKKRKKENFLILLLCCSRIGKSFRDEVDIGDVGRYRAGSEEYRKVFGGVRKESEKSGDVGKRSENFRISRKDVGVVGNYRSGLSDICCKVRDFAEKGRASSLGSIS